MPKLIGDILYLTSAELVGFGFSLYTIQDFLSIPNPENAKYSLYSYDHIAHRSKKSASKLPAKAQLLAQITADNSAQKQNETAQKASLLPAMWAAFYRITDVNYYIGRGYSTDKASKLAQSLALVRFLDGVRLPKRLLVEKVGFERREDLLKAVCTLMSEGIDLPYIPTSYDRLRVKIDNYARYIADKRNKEQDFIIGAKKGNHNAQVIGKPTGGTNDSLLHGGRINVAEFHANTIIVLAMNPGEANKFDWEEVYVRYVRECANKKVEAQSISAVKRFLGLNEIKDLVTWERNSFAEFDKLLPHVHGKRPAFALRKGGVDGFQVDFYTNDKDKYVMLTCVAIYDYHSEAITGFDIGYTETGLLVRNAYRNHLRLHGGKTFFEMDMDGSMANLSTKTKEMFDRVVAHVRVGMGDDPTYKHRSNSKERFSERLIQELNRLTQSVNGWKGTNVTSHNINRKPNPDYAKKHIATVELGIKQIIDIVNVYNNEKLAKYQGKSRLQRMVDKLDPEAEIIDTLTQSQLFNWRTVVQVHGDRIKVTVNKTDYEYFIEDPLAWSHKMDRGRRVVVYYDEDAMDEVHVFGWELDEVNNPTESYLGSLKLGVRAFKDKRSQTSEDKQLIADQVAKRKTMINSVLRKQLEVEAVAFNIDASQYKDIKDLQKVIEGMRQRERLTEDFSTRFNEELNTEDAKAMSKFYEDIYADRGVRIAETIPTERDPKKEELKFKKYNLNKFND